MKKLLISNVLAFSLLAFSNQGMSQNFKCGSSEAQEALFQKHPELRQQQAQFDAYVQQYVAEHYGETNRNSIVIPIVFHVIHDYGVENISDAQIIDQVNILNEDYNLLNADTNLVIPEMKPFIANVGITFKLAQIDPNGNCTNGIDRIASPLTYLGNDEAKLNPWDRRKYLNVWTVKKMSDDVAGYAYKPSGVSGLGFPVDGIIILQDYIGSVGTGSPGKSRALTHEIGHWMNLSHTWGDNNQPGGACGDDGIQDTPITKGWTTCPLPQNSAVCTPGIKENYQNYMDYSYCSFMYTEGQKQAMLAAMNSDVSFRNNLWTLENLTATGVLNPTPCAPKADFYATSKYICSGTLVNFKDNSSNGEVTSWNWSFPGATPSSSTVKNPNVTYPDPGVYPVTLTATNAQGSNTITYNNYIIVSPNWSDYTANYVESFEDALQTEKWINNNPGNNSRKWQRVSNSAYSGSSSMMLSGFNQAQGDVDELISPSYDLRYMSNINLTFKYIGATMATNITEMRDSLTIYASTDCGRNWGTPRLTIKRANLAKAGQTNAFYVPAATDNWSTASFALNPSTYGVANVRFRFRHAAGLFTNNFYMDDINITGVLSTDELGNPETQISISPNPFQNESNITLTLSKAEKVSINIHDLTGRKVADVFNGVQNDNTSSYKIEKSNLSSGVYMVKIVVGDHQIIRKVLVD